jgi:hypothetical protein
MSRSVRIRPTTASSIVPCKTMSMSDSGRYLMRPGWPEDLGVRWSRIYRREQPSVDWLVDGDLTSFHDVLQMATRKRTSNVFSRGRCHYFTWTEMMQRNPDAMRNFNKTAMPGACVGGNYGLTEPELHSVYGQVVLQILQSLMNTPGSGWKIIRAGLRSRIRFHKLTEVKALTNWPDRMLNPEVFAELAGARRDCDDDGAGEVIDTVLIRSGQVGDLLPMTIHGTPSNLTPKTNQAKSATN